MKSQPTVNDRLVDSLRTEYLLPPNFALHKAVVTVLQHKEILANGVVDKFVEVLGVCPIERSVGGMCC